MTTNQKNRDEKHSLVALYSFQLVNWINKTIFFLESSAIETIFAFNERLFSSLFNFLNIFLCMSTKEHVNQWNCIKVQRKNSYLMMIKMFVNLHVKTLCVCDQAEKMVEMIQQKCCLFSRSAAVFGWARTNIYTLPMWYWHPALHLRRLLNSIPHERVAEPRTRIRSICTIRNMF